MESWPRRHPLHSLHLSCPWTVQWTPPGETIHTRPMGMLSMPRFVFVWPIPAVSCGMTFLLYSYVFPVAGSSMVGTVPAAFRVTIVVIHTHQPQQNVVGIIFVEKFSLYSQRIEYLAEGRKWAMACFRGLIKLSIYTRIFQQLCVKLLFISNFRCKILAVNYSFAFFFNNLKEPHDHDAKTYQIFSHSLINLQWWLDKADYDMFDNLYKTDNSSEEFQVVEEAITYLTNL